MIDLTCLGTKKLWLGTEDSFHAFLTAYDKMASGDELVKKEALSRDEEDEENNEHFLLEMYQGVGIINVEGHLVSGSAGYWGQYFGVVGYDDIRNSIITAINSGAEKLFFVYDTPGGSVNGIMELSDFIKSLDIETTSFTSGTAASGGLWLATASNTFYSSRMAEVGSLGVLAVVSEITDMLKSEGVNVRVFKSTPLKAAGNPYEKLSAEAAAQIQSNIDDTHVFFVNEIALNRDLTTKFVSENIANGKVWFGAEAHELRLTDGIRTFDELLLALTQETGNNEQQSNINFQGNNVEATMSRRKILDEQASAAIAAGADVDEVLKGLDSETVDDEEGKDEVDTAADAADDTTDTAADAEASDHSDEEDEDEDEDEDKEVKGGSADKTVTDVLLKQISSLQDESVGLKVKIANLEADAVSHEGLKKATAIAVQKAHVGLGSSAPDLDGLMALDASALLQQHTMVQDQIAKRFGAGGRVTVQVNDEDDEDIEAINAAAKVTSDALLKAATI